MSKMSGIVEFIVFLALVIVLIAIIYIFQEKKKKKRIKKKFKQFTKNHKLSREEMRTVPRISIPEAMDIILTLTDNDYFGLKAHTLNMSLTGFAVKPDFPLKKLPLNIVIKNAEVATPINTFVIREMKAIRIDHQVDKRLIAFHIEKIDGDQFEKLKTFMTYLDNFLKK
jgi:c-di-GMP-binding flagellar brake protein YcgR